MVEKVKDPGGWSAAVNVGENGDCRKGLDAITRVVSRNAACARRPRSERFFLRCHGGLSIGLVKRNTYTNGLKNFGWTPSGKLWNTVV